MRLDSVRADSLDLSRVLVQDPELEGRRSPVMNSKARLQRDRRIDRREGFVIGHDSRAADYPVTLLEGNGRGMKRVALSLIFLCAASSARGEQVVFSEVMYNPPAGGYEFVEVQNLTATPFDIAGWRLTGGVDFEFPPFNAGAGTDSFLKAFERIVICETDPATFRAAYGIPAAVRVFGPWSGNLSDAKKQYQSAITILAKLPQSLETRKLQALAMRWLAEILQYEIPDEAISYIQRGLELIQDDFPTLSAELYLLDVVHQDIVPKNRTLPTE